MRNCRRPPSSLPGRQRPSAERKRLNHHGIFPMVTLVAIALRRYLRPRKPRSMPPALLWDKVSMCSRALREKGVVARKCQELHVKSSDLGSLYLDTRLLTAAAGHMQVGSVLISGR